MKVLLSLLVATTGLVALPHRASAQDSKPTPPAPLAPLPPVEILADDVQARLYKEADRSAGTSSSPQARTTGRKATFATPKADDPARWEKDSVHKLAVMELNFGGTGEAVMFELFPSDAPRTVANFIENCGNGSYNGIAFHRAIPGFLVQTGDPLTADESARDSWGTGGENKSVPAEIRRSHRKGSVAMGRRNDDVNPSRRSNGYQFYFALGNTGALDGKYTVFGQVVSGLPVLEKIAKMPVDNNDCPIARIEVKSIKVIDHQGPLYAAESDSSGRKYTKPAAAKGFFERFLERVW